MLIVPLSAKEEFDPLIREVCKPVLRLCDSKQDLMVSLSASKFRKAGVFARVDDSNTSIGKRYARNDELGTPFGVTLDFACKLFVFISLWVFHKTERRPLFFFAALQNKTMTLRWVTYGLIGSDDSSNERNFLAMVVQKFQRTGHDDTAHRSY